MRREQLAVPTSDVLVFIHERGKALKAELYAPVIRRLPCAQATSFADWFSIVQIHVVVRLLAADSKFKQETIA
jgi:hypothetical protein